MLLSVRAIPNRVRSVCLQAIVALLPSNVRQHGDARIYFHEDMAYTTAMSKLMKHYLIVRCMQKKLMKHYLMQKHYMSVRRLRLGSAPAQSRSWPSVHVKCRHSTVQLHYHIMTARSPAPHGPLASTA